MGKIDWDKPIIIPELEKGQFHLLGHGGCDTEINQEHIEALREGKLIAWFDGEYTHTIKLKEGDDPCK